MNERTRKAELRRQQALCDAWKYPVGTAVSYRQRGGPIVNAVTSSAPWMLLEQTAVIRLEGFTECCELERVRPVQP